MKVKRNKRNRKFLQFYATSYGIKPPYKVVLDGLYLQAALEGKVKILEQVPKLLQAPGETIIMVTKCSIHDLKQKGDFYRGAVMIGSSLKHARCNHEGVIEPGECLKLLIKGGNPDRLIMGAQEVALRHFVRDTPGVPLLFISGQVPILEPPADADKKHIVKDRSERTQLNAEEQKQLEALNPKAPAKVYKRKKVKGPNPLSVKKKKSAPSAPAQKKPVSSPAATISTTSVTPSPSSSSNSSSSSSPSPSFSSSTISATNFDTASEPNPSRPTKKKRVRHRNKAKDKNDNNGSSGGAQQAGEKKNVTSTATSPNPQTNPEQVVNESVKSNNQRKRKNSEETSATVEDGSKLSSVGRISNSVATNSEAISEPTTASKAKRKRTRKRKDSTL